MADGQFAEKALTESLLNMILRARPMMQQEKSPVIKVPSYTSMDAMVRYEPVRVSEMILAHQRIGSTKTVWRGSLPPPK